MVNMKKSKAGRPKKHIDWEKVKNLLMAGSPASEIISHFDIHYDSFYRRCKQDNKMNFTEFANKFREKGASMLRAHQFAKALGHTDKGDNALLIWLGKQRLGQSEPKKEETTAPQNVNYKLNYSNDSNDTISISSSTISTESSKGAK
jgi:hypothetical protein